MKHAPTDGLPVTGTSASTELGARPGTDILVNNGVVVLDGKGMSVAPAWRDLDFTRIPKRLRNKVPGATGGNNTSCFVLGDGAFQKAVFANGLELLPDGGLPTATHGVIAPLAPVSSGQYQADLEATRPLWQVDEA